MNKWLSERLLNVLIVLTAFLPAMAPADTLYKYVGPDGKVVYGDKPPADNVNLTNCHSAGLKAVAAGLLIGGRLENMVRALQEKGIKFRIYSKQVGIDPSTVMGRNYHDLYPISIDIDAPDSDRPNRGKDGEKFEELRLQFDSKQTLERKSCSIMIVR